MVGAPTDPRTAALHRTALLSSAPGAVVAVGAPGGEEFPLLAGRPLVDGAPAAYVCRRFTCDAPVTDAGGAGPGAGLARHARPRSTGGWVPRPASSPPRGRPLSGSVIVRAIRSRRSSSWSRSAQYTVASWSAPSTAIAKTRTSRSASSRPRPLREHLAQQPARRGHRLHHAGPQRRDLRDQPGALQRLLAVVQQREPDRLGDDVPQRFQRRFPGGPGRATPAA